MFNEPGSALLTVITKLKLNESKLGEPEEILKLAEADDDITMKGFNICLAE